VISSILNVIMFTLVAYMCWKGLESYARKQAAPAQADDEQARLRDLDARMQAAAAAITMPPWRHKDLFYTVDAPDGRHCWSYNRDYAVQHYLEMHPYTEC